VVRRARRVIVGAPGLASARWLRGANTTVVPFAVDTDRFHPAARPPHPELNLLFVGRLRHYKGVDVLLEAMGQIPDGRLTIVGGGPEMPRLKSLAVRLGLVERVQFSGEVGDADLPGCYQQADIFVLPSISRAESFGIVLLEAMASGLPCVTTEVGTGTSWVVQDGVTGLVVPPSDPAALAGAIRRLAGDAALRARMGAAGRARVEAEFTQERMVQRVEEVYREVAARS
ncbi:MAG: glycosyltransferase family 4 protein, partial [Chloroflexi bacterium]|nr:glycosyltransferase family 4 protein [Chloroflexota bacterium]